MRILILTQWFDPEPTFKGIVFAAELVRQGFSVEVVTGFPNYPGGKLYDGYKLKYIQREVIDGVHVTRVPLYPSHDNSARKRILNYISFAASSLFYGVFFAKKADVIYSYHPPLTVSIAACAIKFFRRTPVVCDIQDMWPDTLRVTGMIGNDNVLNLVEKVCNFTYRSVNHIVVLSPGFRNLLINRGVSERKISVIYNWADERSLTSPSGSLPNNFPEKNYFRIVFAGNMGKAQALDAVLGAASLLQSRDSRVRFVFIGGGVDVERLKMAAKDLDLANIIFFPPVPMSEVGTFLAAADALIVHLKQDPLFKITIPSKTQAYMAVGKPLLMAVDGDAADLVRLSGGGVVAASENPEEIANAADMLASIGSAELMEMGRKSRDFYNRELSLAIGVSRFGEIFRNIRNHKFN